MGAKNLKGIVIQGDGSFDLPEGKTYPKLFQDVYKKLTDTDMMDKYHNLGTTCERERVERAQGLALQESAADPG